MLDPITPLGQDTLKGMLSGLGKLFHMPRTRHNQTLVLTAAERLWINFTAVARHPIGRKIQRATLPMIDPTAGQALQSLLDDPRLQPQKGWFRPITFVRVGRFLLPALARVLRALRHPDRERRKSQEVMAEIEQQYAGQFATAVTLNEWLDAFEAYLRDGFSFAIRRFVPLIAGGMASLNLTFKLTAPLREQGHDPLVLTRGLPHNVTTEMDLTLWQTAQAIRADETAARHIAEGDPDELAAGISGRNTACRRANGRYPFSRPVRDARPG